MSEPAHEAWCAKRIQAESGREPELECDCRTLKPKPQAERPLVKYRTWRGQKAALTRAINSGDRERVRYECVRVVQHDWTEGSPHTPYWPDDWSRWLRALEDAYHPERAPDVGMDG